MTVAISARNLHQEAVNLKECSKEKLLPALKELENKILEMLKSKDFEPFKIGLTDMQRRIKGISKKLEQDTKANVELDCHGIGIKIKSIFKTFIASGPQNVNFSEIANAQSNERYIIDHDFDVNDTEYLSTSLNLACKEENQSKAVGFIEILCRAGAELNTIDGNRPPLNMVLGHFNASNKEALTKVLTENGADPNHREGEFVRKHHPLPIWMAKYTEKLIPNNVLNPLIDAHMDINMKAASTTPLNENLKNGHKKRAQVLVAAGAKPEWTVPVDKKTEELLKRTAEVREDVLSKYPCELMMMTNTLQNVDGLNLNPKEVLSIVYDFAELKPSEICKIILDATTTTKND